MGKLNSSKRYLYIANGAGLSPNINRLRFYDSGLTYYTNKVFYDETNTYAMWIAPTAYWYIALISADRNFPGNAFAKVVSNSGEPPTGNYIGANGYSGTVNISLYTSNKNISIKKQNIFVSAPEESVNPLNGADPRGRFLLQNTLVNGNKWYFKSATQTSPIHRIVRNSTTGQWFIQFLFNNWITSYTSIDSANNPWEATWSNNVQISLGSGGKLSLKSSAIPLNILNIRVNNGPTNAPWGVGGSGPCGNDFQLLNNQNGIWSQSNLSCDFFIAWDNQYGNLPYKWRMYYDSDGRVDYAFHPTAGPEALPSKGWSNGMTITAI